MTNETYNKAQEIQKQISEFEQLRHIVSKPFQRYFFKTAIFGMSTYDRSEICLGDKGLTEVIRQYCDKRLKELKDELAAL